MNIAICGGTGFLGRQLSDHLVSSGHTMVLIRRSDLQLGVEHLSKLMNSADVVINLAGSPVIKRWTTKNRIEMTGSRITTTQLLVKAMLFLPESARPGLFLSASAIGIYNSTQVHGEDSGAFGDGFLATLCRQWEDCLAPLAGTGIRTITLRIGIVLGREGGMIRQLWPLFRAGLGGRIGSGNQYLSFIHIVDFCNAVTFLILNEHCGGVFNMVAPVWTTNRQFTKEFASACNRPAIFTVPALAVKLVFGEGAVTLLEGQAVLPVRLLEFGFRFTYPDIRAALTAICQTGKE